MKIVRNKNKADKKNGKVVAITCAAIIIVLLVVIIILLLQKKEEPKRNVVVNEKNAEEVVAQMAATDYTEPGYYTVNMATEWHFSKGDAVSEDARVDNVARNTNPVYFDVFLKDDEEEPIYSSPVIPVGSYLENIALEKILEAGNF